MKMLEEQMKLMTQMMAKMTQDSSSVSSEAAPLAPIDLQRTMENVLTKLRVDSHHETWDLLRTMYIWKPEAFIIVGSLHTNSEGDKTYCSVRIQQSESFYTTMHINGTLRFNKFKATSVSILTKSKEELVFNIVQPPPKVGGMEWRPTR